MSFGDVRAALFIAYAVLIVWRGLAGMPEGVIVYMVVFNVLIWTTRLIERLVLRARILRNVEALSSADPELATAMIDRMWSGHARRHYRAAVAGEGAIDQDGTTERFPFLRSAQRRADQMFWTTAILAFALLTSLFVVRWPSAIGWGVWIAGFILAGVAGMWRSHARQRATLIEITPWEISQREPTGQRRDMLRWSQPLLLQNQPARRRVLLTAERGEPRIELHYARVGFGRLLSLVLERGGFIATSADATDTTDITDTSEAPASGRDGESRRA